MIPEIPIIERAFQLALSGDYRTVRGITDTLFREGFSSKDLLNIRGLLSRQLKGICDKLNPVADNRPDAKPPSFGRET